MAEQLSTLTTPARISEMKAEAAQALSTQTKNIRAMPPDPSEDQTFLEDIDSLSPKYPPPVTLPCANVQAEKYAVCDKPGKMACSACKLVSYCSKECQSAHWKLHKRDCKNSMMSKDWEPIWRREQRTPIFLNSNETDSEEFPRLGKEEFSSGKGKPLWGNVPAVDVINLASNENDAKKDFSLAFIASGDLRHVLRTFNGLPEDYSGHLNILLNDLNPVIFCRNVVLLLILGNVPDETIAADMALHFWYSTFMPKGHRLLLSSILVSFLRQTAQDSTINLGPCSKLSTIFLQKATTIFSHFISSELSIGDIQEEYNRVRTAPSRRDFSDRMYLALRPPHRVAFHKFRRFGIVLPFGAMNSHFDSPNLSLFSTEGKWLQTDYADPLEGWDIPTIIKTGKAHGARSEDIYGCLYFFLSRQLRTLAHRLRKFSSTFTVLNLDARRLPQLIRDNSKNWLNLPPSIRFDRIEVSNILDSNYVGLHDVLALWAPFLQEGRNAAIIGYFMNWVVSGNSKLPRRASQADDHVVLGLWQKVMAREKAIPKGKLITPGDAMFNACTSGMEAFYENSGPFFKYLQSEGLDGVLRKTNLRLREKHAVVPHRILARLGGSPTALPHFPDDDAWYYSTKLLSRTWTARYVEFQRK